jgi:hypothetical protein
MLVVIVRSDMGLFVGMSSVDGGWNNVQVVVKDLWAMMADTCARSTMGRRNRPMDMTHPTMESSTTR